MSRLPSGRVVSNTDKLPHEVGNERAGPLMVLVSSFINAVLQCFSLLGSSFQGADTPIGKTVAFIVVVHLLSCV